MRTQDLSNVDFAESDIGLLLAQLSSTEFDQFCFGVIGFDVDERVQIYNVREAEMAGLNKVAVIGGRMFEVVAPCMNNYLVADKFKHARERSSALDVMLPYVLTLRMRPTPCRLRLLSVPKSALQFILISRANL